MIRFFFFVRSYASWYISFIACVCVFVLVLFFGFSTISLEPLKRISQVSSISQSQSLRLEMDVRGCQFLLFCFACRWHRTNESKKKKSIGTSLQVKAAWKTNLKKREWDIRNILIWNFCHFVLSSKTVLNLIFFPWYVRCAKTYTHSESMPTILHSSFGMWMLAILFYGIATILRQLFFFMLIVLSFFF